MAPIKTEKFQPLNHLILRYDGKSMFVPTPGTYRDALEAVYSEFPTINRLSTLSLQTSELDACQGEAVVISSSSFPDIVGYLRRVDVVLESPAYRTETAAKDIFPLIPPLVCQSPSPSPRPMPPVHNLPDTRERMCISIMTLTGTFFSVEVFKDQPWKAVFDVIADKHGIPSEEMRTVFQGRQLGRDSDAQVGTFLEDGSMIHIVKALRGRKPVIYVYSPDDIDVGLKLSLNFDWKFSAIYPVVPVTTSSKGQTICWDVHTHQDGTLMETNTNLEVSYLFWEAETLPSPCSQPDTPPLGPADLEPFVPATADLHSSNSVVLKVESMTPYLDKALGLLGLHVEARTSFITYWLPSLLRHKHVALRFLPQSSYERAAPLEVTPTPDVVTRVFMLFKGVKEDNLHYWSDAFEKAEEDPSWWISVVGVDVEKNADTSLLRVLEWGGMEVLR